MDDILTSLRKKKPVAKSKIGTNEGTLLEAVRQKKPVQGTKLTDFSQNPVNKFVKDQPKREAKVAVKAGTAPQVRKKNAEAQAKFITLPDGQRVPRPKDNDDAGWAKIYDLDAQATAKVGVSAGVGKPADMVPPGMIAANLLTDSADEVIAKSQQDKAFVKNRLAGQLAPLDMPTNALQSFLGGLDPTLKAALEFPLTGIAAQKPTELIGDFLTKFPRHQGQSQANPEGQFYPGDALSSLSIALNPNNQATPLQRGLAGAETYANLGMPGVGRLFGLAGRSPKKPPVVAADADLLAQMRQLVAPAEIDPVKAKYATDSMVYDQKVNALKEELKTASPSRKLEIQDALKEATAEFQVQRPKPLKSFTPKAAKLPKETQVSPVKAYVKTGPKAPVEAPKPGPVIRMNSNDEPSFITSEDAQYIYKIADQDHKKFAKAVQERADILSRKYRDNEDARNEILDIAGKKLESNRFKDASKPTMEPWKQSIEQLGGTVPKKPKKAVVEGTKKTVKPVVKVEAPTQTVSPPSPVVAKVEPKAAFDPADFEDKGHTFIGGERVSLSGNGDDMAAQVWSSADKSFKTLAKWKRGEPVPVDEITASMGRRDSIKADAPVTQRVITPETFPEGEFKSQYTKGGDTYIRHSKPGAMPVSTQMAIEKWAKENGVMVGGKTPATITLRGKVDLSKQGMNAVYAERQAGKVATSEATKAKQVQDFFDQNPDAMAQIEAKLEKGKTLRPDLLAEYEKRKAAIPKVETPSPVTSKPEVQPITVEGKYGNRKGADGIATTFTLRDGTVVERVTAKGLSPAWRVVEDGQVIPETVQSTAEASAARYMQYVAKRGEKAKSPPVTSKVGEGVKEPSDIARMTDDEVESALKAVPINERSGHPLMNEYNKRDLRNAGRRKAIAEREAQEAQAKADRVAPYKALVEGKDPKAAANIVNAMEKQMRVNGKAVTRRQLVDQAIADGHVVEVVKGERRLSHPDGSFWAEGDITKTAMDYAESLQRAKSPSPKPVEKVETGKVDAPKLSLAEQGRQARANKSLDETRIRLTNGDVVTLRGHVDKMLEEGLKPEIRNQPKYLSNAWYKKEDKLKEELQRLGRQWNPHESADAFRARESKIADIQRQLKEGNPKTDQYVMGNTVISKAQYDYAVSKTAKPAGPSVGPPKESEGRVPVAGSMGPRYRFGSGRSRGATRMFDPYMVDRALQAAKEAGVKGKAATLDWISKNADVSGDMSGWSEAYDKWAGVAVKGAKPTTETDSQKKIDARVKQLEKQIKDLLDGTVKPERGKITSDRIKELVDQRDALKASIKAANAPAPSTGAKVRASVKAVRLANPGNRAMDVASNTLSTSFEQVASTFDGAFDRLLFPKARITHGPASGVQWLSAWDSLKGARKRWGAEFKTVMKNGDPAILKKYNMVEAPGPLKYVQRFTGTTDIPFRDFVYQASKRELNRINPNLSAEVVEEIAMEEAARNTFMGDSWGTKLWDKFEEGVREVGGEAGLTLVDQLVPFPRVIGNIAGRTTDYLGLGLAKGASKAVKGSVTKTLDVASRREINRLMSRGLVGTGLLYAGARLYDAGLLNPVELNKQYGYADWGNYFGVFKPDQLGPQTAVVLLGAAWQAINKSDMTPKQKASMKAKIVMDVPMGTPVVGGMEKVGRFAGDPIGTTNKQLATVVIPSILNAIAEASDLDSKGQPVKRDTSPDRGLLAPYKKRVPVVRKTLPPK